MTVANTEHNTKTPRRATGLFALLGTLLHVKGTSAPKIALVSLPALFLALFACSAAPAFASGDANTASCPSDTEASPGFRTYLPDCRAFELVTPPYDGDEQATGPNKTFQPLVSPDGDHLLGEDFAGFAGVENLEENNQGFFGGIYEFSRGRDGWTAEGLDPPASSYPRSRLVPEGVGASVELNRTLWELDARPASSAEGVFSTDAATLGVREAAGGGKGAYTLLGSGVSDPSYQPDDSNFHVVGSSAELTRILVSVDAGPHFSWPGDETEPGDYSLYEYQDREGYEPVLVGVSNVGALHGPAHVNEGAALLSECGTGFNAISGAGDAVYFTADHVAGCPQPQPTVSELAVRVDGERTIDLSEPPLSGPEAVPGRECTGACQAAQETSPQPATFRGISSDGSEVFFTSEQPLVNTATGTGPYLYEETIAREGVASHATSLALLAKQVSGVPVLATDGTRIYFESQATLTDEPNGNGEVAGEEPGAMNLYVADTGEPGDPVRFVAQDPSGEAEGGFESGAAFDTTADGQYLAFESPKNLRGTADHSTAPGRQLFEYNALTGAIVRVSVGDPVPGGAECEATKTVEADYGCDGDTNTQAESPRMPSPPDTALAEDGTVVFSSQLPLTAGAPVARDVAETFSREGHQAYTENLYEYEQGNVYLISPGDETTPLAYPEVQAGKIRLYGVDPSGEDIFFGTTDSLVPQDTDSQYSWYDAHEAGGFPAPAPPAECKSEACQGASPATPVFAGPGSNSLTASGNLAPAVEPKPAVKPAAKPKAKRCKKGFTKKHNKCVKNRKKPEAKKASNDRRGNS